MHTRPRQQRARERPSCAPCRGSVETHRSETTLPPVADRLELVPPPEPTRVRTEDWPAQATDTIVKAVGTASNKVTGPVTTIARGIVFGLFAVILGVAAIVLLTIMLVRIVNNYLPDSVFGDHHVWAAHMVVGAVFLTASLAVWSARKPRPAEAA